MKIPTTTQSKCSMRRLVCSSLVLLVAFSVQQPSAIAVAPRLAASADVLGDANGDGVLNNLDLSSFVLALFNRPMYNMVYPTIDADVTLDMNGDGALNNLDISGFVTALFAPPSVQAPSDLQAGPSGTANAIGLSWTASSTADITGYQIRYGMVSEGLANRVDVGNVTSAVIGGLTTDQNYTLAVVACTDGGQSRADDARITAQPDAAVGLVPLFNGSTTLEAPTTIDTPNALITLVSDRVRDRHAREAQFQAYDHYLSWYWEQRMMNIEIIDRVGRNGGNNITFNYTTQRRLNPAEFRTFYRGITTSAEYSNNQIATLVSTNASTSTPGETDFNYSVDVNTNTMFNRPLQLGDRMEIEISQFLLGPRNGRSNYYGTTMLYIVGQGIVPWGQGQDLGFNGGVVGNVNQRLDSYPLPFSAWLGGKTTLHRPYSNEPEHAFKQIASNLSPTNGFDFMLGRRLHHTDFGNGTHSEAGNPVFASQAGKLGSKFVARSCVACHVNNGRSLPAGPGQAMSQSLVKVGSDSSGSPHSGLGAVLQSKSTGGAGEGNASISSYTIVNGNYGDGTPFSLRTPVYAFSGTTPSHYSVRVAPALVGMGLLEAISESSITALADPGDSDMDGISGRTQIVTDPETGQPRLGRFGYKGASPKISHQVAIALNTDLGVTTSIFPILDGQTSAVAVEVSDSEIDLMTRYVALLGVQARRDLNDAQAQLGESLFVSVGCADCHTRQFTTSPHHPMAELRSQTIQPFSDLLLHDMGPELADNMGEGIATGSEWRTAPLWNIGHAAGVNETGEAYLHDGRARTLAEAILWHGGEGQASKEAFRALSASERAAIIKFLKSL